MDPLFATVEVRMLLLGGVALVGGVLLLIQKLRDG